MTHILVFYLVFNNYNRLSMEATVATFILLNITMELHLILKKKKKRNYYSLKVYDSSIIFNNLCHGNIKDDKNKKIKMNKKKKK